MTLRPEDTLLAAKDEQTVPSIFVILGAAVWSGGRPSNAMRRRVEGALRSAAGVTNPSFLVSGGVGKHPPSEAAVMSKLLQEAGVPQHNILLEEESTDTLQSVRNCVRILKTFPATAAIVVSSDVYHIPRCRWLFRMYGVKTSSAEVVSGRSQNRMLRWWYYYLREFAAIPWDTLMALISREKV